MKGLDVKKENGVYKVYHLDWDIETREMMASIINSAIERSITSGIPIDPNKYDCIEKIKLLGKYCGNIHFDDGIIIMYETK